MLPVSSTQKAKMVYIMMQFSPDSCKLFCLMVLLPFLLEFFLFETGYYLLHILPPLSLWLTSTDPPLHLLCSICHTSLHSLCLFGPLYLQLVLHSPLLLCSVICRPEVPFVHLYTFFNLSSVSTSQSKSQLSAVLG